MEVMSKNNNNNNNNVELHEISQCAKVLKDIQKANSHHNKMDIWLWYTNDKGGGGLCGNG